MYRKGVIDAQQFAILQAPNNFLESSLTLGDYEKVPDKMMRVGAHLISHRIAGSFHW